MATVQRVKTPGLAALIVLVALVGTGCGYSLAGRGSFLPEYIRTVGVPLFTNTTPAFEVEETLTQRVRAEFIGRGRYQVLPEATGADAVLTGEIVNIHVEPTGFTGDRQASRYAVKITTRIEFRDMKTNAVLWENPAMVFTDEYEITADVGSADASTFFEQETTSVERMATSFARAVVSAIMEAF
jgi:hypothetical protein